MMDINVRGTFLLTKAALPHLRKSAEHAPRDHPGAATEHEPVLAGRAPVYTLSKYGMTLLSLGWAAEYADAGIGFSCLWPETYIATAAVTNLAAGDELVADRASADHGRRRGRDPVPAGRGGQRPVLHRSAVLADAGVTDLSRYGGGDDPILDIFVDKP